MNGRVLAAELSTLVARTLWVYAGVALALSGLPGESSLSIGAVAGVVALSHVLTRLLRGTEASEVPLPLWGAGIALALFYLVLRLDVAGEPYVWKLGWLVDLLVDPGDALNGHARDLAEVVLLSGAWLYVTQRALDDPDLEDAMGEVSLGLLVVGVAAVLAPAAGAASVVSWLPLPYLVAGFLALALLASPAGDRRSPSAGAPALSAVGCLAVVAALAVLAGTTDWPSLEGLGRALSLALRGMALAVAYAMAPLFIVANWVAEHLRGLLAGEQQDMSPEPAGGPPAGGPADNGPSGLPVVLRYGLRSGAVIAVLALGLALLWSAFRRLSHRRRRGLQVREKAESGDGTVLQGLRSMLSEALERLRRRVTGAPRGRDAIGRLYLSMLRLASAQGLPRPVAATPLEFAGELERHFRSPLPRAISVAYAEARYGRHPCPGQEVERLRSGWQQLRRGGAPGARANAAELP